MFGPLGVWEVLFILVLALLIFGPKRLPEVGRTIGRGVSEFRRATTDIKRTIEREIDLDDSRPPPASTRPRIAGLNPPPSGAASGPPPAEPPAVAPEGAAMGESVEPR